MRQILGCVALCAAEPEFVVISILVPANTQVLTPWGTEYSGKHHHHLTKVIIETLK